MSNRTVRTTSSFLLFLRFSLDLVVDFLEMFSPAASGAAELIVDIATRFIVDVEVSRQNDVDVDCTKCAQKHKVSIVRSVRKVIWSQCVDHHNWLEDGDSVFNFE
jgi:hypothetical protein